MLRPLRVDPQAASRGHDSPEITPPEHLRFDAGWTIDESLPPECGLGQQTIPGGTYALTTYVGPFSMLGLAYADVPIDTTPEQRKAT